MGKLTAPAIATRKTGNGSEPLVMVTAYDAPGARIASEAGADLILVGDSLAMVVLGYDDTLQVTIDDMCHHTAAVARAKPDCHIVGDMPWMSYHVSPQETVENAAKLMRAGAHSVKLEGGRKRLPMIEQIIDAEIPVMSPARSTFPRSGSVPAPTATVRCSSTTTSSASRTGSCRSSCVATPTSRASRSRP